MFPSLFYKTSCFFSWKPVLSVTAPKAKQPSVVKEIITHINLLWPQRQTIYTWKICFKNSSYRYTNILHPDRQEFSSWCKTSSPLQVWRENVSLRHSPSHLRLLRCQLTAAGAPRPGAACRCRCRWNSAFAWLQRMDVSGSFFLK